MSIVEKLRANLKKPNIADDIDGDTLAKLGQEVVNTFEVDRTAMEPWENQVKDALKLAQQIKETKSTPWEGAANVKFPLLTVAAIQFAARAYPEIVRAGSIVKSKVQGKDPDNSKELRGSRIACHMNWQLTDEMTEWESDTDQLLHILPILGMVWRKTYYDPGKGRNVSEIFLPTDCYVNHKARTEDTARRITHRYWLYENDIWERQKSGVWREVDLGKGQPEDGQEGDTDVPHEILEQHRYYDLDGDGYAEPLVVTVHKQTSKVVRIVARYEESGIKTNDAGKLVKIEATNHFVLYQFLPNPDGSIFALGFGQLLEPINETINTTINQLLDAGTIGNAGGGFLGRGIKIKGGVMRFHPGEWKFVETTGQNIRDNVFPLPVRDPSPVLFQLLGFLTQGAKDIAAVQDILGGDTKMAANIPATTMMALIEQGLKVYNSIYKRIYRSLSREFKNLYALNARYVDQEKYLEVIGTQWEPPKENKAPGMLPPGIAPPAGPLQGGGPMPLPPQGMPPMDQMMPPMNGPMQGLPGLPMLAGAMGAPAPDYSQDYTEGDIEVIPVADPAMSTEMQRMAKVQAVAQFSGRPGINEVELTRQLVRGIHPLDEDKLLLSDKQLSGEEPTLWKPPTPPQAILAQAKAMDVQAKAMESQARMKMDMEKFGLELELLEAQITKIKTAAMLDIAKSESEINEDAFRAYKVDVDRMMQESQQKLAMMKQQFAQQQAMQQMQAQQQAQPGQPKPGGPSGGV